MNHRLLTRSLLHPHSTKLRTNPHAMRRLLGLLLGGAAVAAAAAAQVRLGAPLIEGEDKDNNDENPPTHPLFHPHATSPPKRP
jgi:hypothetical protein